jgi:hypothetical protein
MLDHIARMGLDTYKGKRFYLYTGGGSVLGLGGCRVHSEGRKCCYVVIIMR